MLSLKTLERPKTPNTYLLAPIGYCEAADVDGQAPVFAGISAAKLKTMFVQAIENEPRLVTLQDEALAMEFRQKTPLVGWPDFIIVNFLDLEGGDSTLAIYSRSKYGRKDFGVNQKRVMRWLDLLGNKS